MEEYDLNNLKKVFKEEYTVLGKIICIPPVSNSTEATSFLKDINRSTGKTTRLIDYYIQELYNNPNSPIKIIDHCDHPQSSKYLIKAILRRLNSEHYNDKFKQEGYTLIYIK